MEEGRQIHSEDYQRLFRLKGGVVYLLSDVFGGYYKNLDCLLTGINGIWTSYLPKKIVEGTLQYGFDLLNDENKFNKYVKDFDEYKERSKKLFETELQKRKLTQQATIQLFTTISKMFSFYSKTEFFYTDKAYMALEQKPSKALIRNIESFEEVKSAGRQYLNQLIFSGGYTDQLIDLLSKQFDVPREKLRLHKVSEVIELFQDKEPSQESLSARADAFVQYAKDSNMFYIEGEAAKTLLSHFLTTDHSSEELKGMIANKGVVRGTAKIIPTDYYSDFSILTKLFHQINEGDILVAETTSPELMPACKKAGAIVTDQGGLLSHAAIVSRELGIPCVVGTGNATEV